MAYVLFGYWRSSAAYRVRIGLHLKGIPFDYKSVHLIKDGGEQRSAEFMEKNPSKLVPVLQTPEGDYLTQSLAILEYLDELYPDPALLPKSPLRRAQARAIAMAIACDVHPLNNLRILQFLKSSLECSDEARDNWYAHWIHEGFGAVERMLEKTHGLYCIGDEISVADICLVPQVYNAHRFNVPLSRYPLISAIDERCRGVPCFERALPESQSDAVK
jgi:maleylacetoacetate isomerase